MYLKKVLNQPNLVGTVMIALLFGAGFVYAFAFNGFNVETVTGGEVETWLAQAAVPCSCGKDHCVCERQNASGNNPCGGKTFKWPCPKKNSECRQAHHPHCPCREKGDVIDVCATNKKKKKDKCNGKGCRNK